MSSSANEVYFLIQCYEKKTRAEAILKEVKKITDINDKAFEIGSTIKLLGNLSWPLKAEQEFLSSYKKGKVVLPKIHYAKVDYSTQREALQKLVSSFSAHDPMEVFTRDTINSYIDAIDLNHCIGTDSFTELSKKVFGFPGDPIPGAKKNIIDSAEELVRVAIDFIPPFIKAPAANIDAHDVKKYMDRRIEGAFKGRGPEVIVTSDLAAKATATSKIIKLREGAHFTEYDFKQLFYHEVMTHSLTAINGSEQKILSCLGRGSLRTLKTQEGLATFSEVITGGMDIRRLTRLALRILAIDLALNGASFLDIFEFFVSKGQSEKESYLSTQRIFRGGFPDKNIVFTKDCIYLEGLINVHTLFRWAMKHNRLETCHLLFCGRLSLEDVFSLQESYDNQLISPPKYLPAWFSKIEGLAGSLSFSLLANLIRIDVADKNFYKVA